MENRLAIRIKKKVCAIAIAIGIILVFSSVEHLDEMIPTTFNAGRFFGGSAIIFLFYGLLKW